VAQRLKALRHEHGALDLQTLEARPVFAGDEIQDLRLDVEKGYIDFKKIHSGL
jgi:exoribonuclease-2